MSRSFIQSHSVDGLSNKTIKNFEVPQQKSQKGKPSRSDSEQLQDFTRQSVSILPEAGYVRLPTVLAVIPISKASWWNGVRSGRFPKPTKKFGPKISAWDVRDIRALIESAAV